MYYFKGLTFIQFRIQYTEQNPYVLFHYQFLVGGAGRGGDADDVGACRQRRDVECGGEAVDGGAQMALAVEVEQLDVAYAERRGHRHVAAGRVGHNVGVAVGCGLNPCRVYVEYCR